MADKKDTKRDEWNDSASYGGSRNRLSYEKIHGEQSQSNKSDWTTRLGLFFILFGVFALIGIWIVWYFDSSLTKIFSKNDARETEAASVQQTYIVSEADK